MNQLELTNSLAKASELYYAGQTTEYTDTEFDLALKELQKMEKESGIVYPNSPTQRVGSDIQKEFKKGKHPKPMLTIENAYNDEDVQKWVKKMTEDYGVQFYNLSVKYDGISCELCYENGVLTTALTRGDKNIGDDITNNVKTIKDVPLDLRRFLGSLKRFYVRGEILLPKSRLDEINAERISFGLPVFANTRNACSGSVKQLDSRVTAKRGLIFRPWDCFCDALDFGNMEDKQRFLKRIGFTIENDTYVAVHASSLLEEISKFKESLNGMHLDFDYDGVVVKVNAIRIQDEIGTKDTRAIEWGIARKWNEELLVNTRLNDVEWQVGRTGVVTPVGKLEPVECGGVVISNVTLNNVDFIKTLNLHIGDLLKITRSGGVIPYVLGVLENSPKHGKEDEVKIPEYCPVCGGKLVKIGALLKCTNDKCPATETGKILQFCSKDCADVRSIGESVVDDLYNAGLVRNINDLLNWGRLASETWRIPYIVKDWLSVLGEGYGETSVTNMLESLAKSKNETTYDRLLSSLSIPGVGKVMARTLAAKYPTIQLLKECTVDDLKSIDGIADITANNIYKWLSENYLILNDIEFNGWATSLEQQEEQKEQVLAGLNVCFSGSSCRFKGDAVEDFLTDNGAKCGHSISKKTNYLIIGEKPGGSKVAKAQELGVEIIEENKFYEKYGL